MIFEHIVNSYKKTLDFSARSSRAEYLSFALFVVLLQLLTLFMAATFENGLVQFLHTVVCVVHIPIGLSALSRRLRDGGTTQWVLPLAFVPILNLILIYPVLFKGSVPKE